MANNKNTYRQLQNCLLIILAAGTVAVVALADTLRPLADRTVAACLSGIEAEACLFTGLTLEQFGFECRNSSKASDLIISDPSRSGEVSIFTQSVLFGSTRATVFPIMILSLATGAVIAWKWKMGWIRFALAVLLAGINFLAYFFAAVFVAISIKLFVSDISILHWILHWHVPNIAGTAAIALVLFGLWWILVSIVVVEETQEAPIVP